MAHHDVRVLDPIGDQLDPVGVVLPARIDIAVGLLVCGKQLLDEVILHFRA